MKVGIIGGGMMGLATAYFLSKAGHDITVLEKEGEIGGLSRSTEIGPGFRWDSYYHVILSTDEALMGFIEEIGLGQDIDFYETRTGFFTDGKLYSMSNTKEFLGFKPLSLWDKFRLGLGILYSSRIKDWKHLEQIYAKDWLTKVFGRKNYEKMWDPLLFSKLGSAKDEVSAAFIWAIIVRYYGTRQKSSKTELMGTVRGGYHTILRRVQERLLENKAEVLVGCRADRIEPLPDGNMRVVCQDGKTLEFDRVIATVPSPEIVKICPDLTEEYRAQLERVRYLSIMCVALLLERSLVPFYVTNLTDPGFPITGLIEATHVVSKEMIGDRALVYLPKWLPADDPFYKEPDENVISKFLQSLKRIIPEFSEQNIIQTVVHRDPFVQPILGLGYSESIPAMISPLKNFYVVNTSMILNSTLNNNQVIQLARRMAGLFQ